MFSILLYWLILVICFGFTVILFLDVNIKTILVYAVKIIVIIVAINVIVIAIRMYVFI
mgnify:CR=1 FL=1